MAGYQVLARALRPKQFSEMVGQTHVLKALSNALTQQRIHHAYLFTGTRGVGKTTIARILAKCLNCEKGPTPTPCNECDACLSIDEGRFIDLIEVDAASRTKVEDTRELLDNIQYAPTMGRYKIYLIDEVHMLSGHSFNALLKTLEEPPKHVIFLLATTNPDKLPMTVLSRCLQFHLKHLSKEQINKYLETILTAEKTTFDEQAIDMIATAADGSMRDALSLLEQAMASSPKHLDANEIRQLVGGIDKQVIYALIEALAHQKPEQLMAHIESLASHNPNYDHALDTLAQSFYQMSVQQLLPDMPIDESNEAQMVQKFSRLISKEYTQLYYDISIRGKRDLPYAPHPRIGFEMTLLRMLAFAPQKITKPTANPKQKTELPKPEAKAPIAKTPTKATQAEAKQPALKNPASSDWENIVHALSLKGPTLAMAKECEWHEKQSHKITLHIGKTHSPLITEPRTTQLESALAKYFAENIKLKIVPIEAPLSTPAKKESEALEKNREKAAQIIDNDTQVRRLLSSFDGKVRKDSIENH